MSVVAVPSPLSYQLLQPAAALHTEGAALHPTGLLVQLMFDGSTQCSTCVNDQDPYSQRWWLAIILMSLVLVPPPLPQ
jgi:hypothetical protein